MNLWPKTFPHHRLKGHDRYRLRVGDYRIIYTFDAERNVIHLLAWAIGGKSTGTIEIGCAALRTVSNF